MGARRRLSKRTEPGVFRRVVRIWKERQTVLPEEVDPLNDAAPRTLRWFWLVLYALAVGLVLLLLFATLQERPFSPVALRHFSVETLTSGRQFSREVQVMVTLNYLASVAVMLWLCFRPSGVRLLQRLEALGRGRFWPAALAVLVGLILFSALVDLPFAYYLELWHERAYGVSHQTVPDWLMQQGKSLLVGLATSCLFYLPILWMIRRWPGRWWIPASLLNFAFSGLMALLYPLVLLPLFNELRPVEDPALHSMIQRLADRAGVEVEALREIRVSHETSRVNAMVTGLGPTKQVIFYDTLLQQFTPEEVEVVMAHELAHAAHHDVAVNWLLGGLGETAVFWAAAWVLRRSVDVAPLSPPAPHAPRGIALLFLLLLLAGQITAPFSNAISRRAEVRADQFALTVTGNPDAFIATFKKLGQGNPGEVDPHPVVELLSHSHPSIVSRIRTAEP